MLLLNIQQEKYLTILIVVLIVADSVEIALVTRTYVGGCEALTHQAETVPPYPYVLCAETYEGHQSTRTHYASL